VWNYYRMATAPMVRDVLRVPVWRCQASVLQALLAQCVGGPLICWASRRARRRCRSGDHLGLGVVRFSAVPSGQFSGALVAFVLFVDVLAQAAQGAAWDCGAGGGCDRAGKALLGSPDVKRLTRADDHQIREMRGTGPAASCFLCWALETCRAWPVAGMGGRVVSCGGGPDVFQRACLPR